MADLLMIGITLLFFILSFGLIRFFDSLSEQVKREQQ